MTIWKCDMYIFSIVSSLISCSRVQNKNLARMRHLSENPTVFKFVDFGISIALLNQNKRPVISCRTL